MGDDERFAIPCGLDRSGNEVYRQEAKKGTTYTCPNCGNLLEFRSGEQLEYFAHVRNVPETHDCDLYSGLWGQVLTKRGRTPYVDLDAAERRIRLAVRKHPYRPTLELLGLVACADVDEWVEWGSKEWVVTSSGLLRPTQREDFHPARGRAELNLDPTAGQYELHIEQGPSSLRGTWAGSLGDPTPPFLGSRDFAESRPNLSRVRSGQYLYLPYAPGMSGMSGDSVTLGHGQYVGFELTPQSVTSLGNFVEGITLDNGGFEVHVVLPPSQPPLQTEAIVGRPGTRVVLQLVSSTELIVDPPIDVLELPTTKHSPAVLPSQGSGVPRQMEFDIPPDCAKRFYLSWGGRHVYIQATPSAESDAQVPDALPPEVQLTYVGSRTVLMSASFGSNRVFVVPNDPALRGQRSRWRVHGPHGYPLSVEHWQRGADGALQRIRRDGLTPDTVPAVIEATLPDSHGAIKVDAGMLGLIEFRLNEFSREEIKVFDFDKRVGEVGGCAGHVNWSYIMAVLDLPKGTNHSEFPGGLRKRVRHAVMRARKEGR